MKHREEDPLPPRKSTFDIDYWREVAQRKFYTVSKQAQAFWNGLEQHDTSSWQRRVHTMGVRLMARIDPNETFLRHLHINDSSVIVFHAPNLDSQQVHKSVLEVAQMYPHFHFRIVAIVRNMTTIIPTGDN